MVVTFKDKYGNERSIGSCDSKKSAFKLIDDFLASHNYKSYYYRTSYDVDNNRLVVDVGSWSEFFYIYGEEGDLSG